MSQRFSREKKDIEFECANKIHKATRDRDESEKLRQQIQSALSVKQEAMNRLQQEFSALKAENDCFRSEQTEMISKLEEKESERFRKLRQEFHEQLSEQRDTHQAEIQQASAKESSLREELRALESSLAETRSSCETALSNMANISRENEALHGEVSTLTTRQQAHERELQAVRDKSSNEQQAQATKYSETIAALTRSKEEAEFAQNRAEARAQRIEDEKAEWMTQNETIAEQKLKEKFEDLEREHSKKRSDQLRQHATHRSNQNPKPLTMRNHEATKGPAPKPIFTPNMSPPSQGLNISRFNEEMTQSQDLNTFRFNEEMTQSQDIVAIDESSQLSDMSSDSLERMESQSLGRPFDSTQPSKHSPHQGHAKDPETRGSQTPFCMPSPSEIPKSQANTGSKMLPNTPKQKRKSPVLFPDHSEESKRPRSAYNAFSTMLSPNSNSVSGSVNESRSASQTGRRSGSAKSKRPSRVRHSSEFSRFLFSSF